MFVGTTGAPLVQILASGNFHLYRPFGTNWLTQLCPWCRGEPTHSTIRAPLYASGLGTSGLLPTVCEFSDAAAAIRGMTSSIV